MYEQYFDEIFHSTFSMLFARGAFSVITPSQRSPIREGITMKVIRAFNLVCYYFTSAE